MPSRDTSDTSGATFRLMRPPASTVGVKRRPTPNSFSSSDTLLFSWATGMKIFPPARKLPSCPLTAITFGSARMQPVAVGLVNRQRARRAGTEKIGQQGAGPAARTKARQRASLERLEQAFRDLGNLHFQHDLLGRRDGEHIDDLIGPAPARFVRRRTARCPAAGIFIHAPQRARFLGQEGAGQLGGTFRCEGIAHCSSEHHLFVGRTDLDVFLVWQRQGQYSLDGSRIQDHLDVDHAARAAAPLDDHVGGANVDPHQVQGVGRDQHGLCHGRVAHAAMAHRFRQAHQRRFAHQ